MRKFTKPVEVEGNTLNGFPFHDGVTGAPILDQAPAYVDCEVRETVEVGNHTLFIGEVVDAGFQADEETEVLRMEDTRMNYGGLTVDIAGPRITAFPETGTSADDLLAEIDDERTGDIDWRSGRAFSLVYHHADEELEGLQHDVADRFLHENALNPFAYRTLPRMEQEVVLMAGDLFGGEPGAGSLTSGGTESIFLAVQVARDDARERGIAEPELVTASTAHPAFAKAAKYLDVTHRRIPVAEDLRLHGEQVAEAIDDRTGLVVGSAPCYPYGLIDDITGIAAAAAERGVLCHVDACLGGWLLPWWERLGEPVPPWDLRVPGVTSLSADVHKYGYATKGASTVLYAGRDLYRHQLFLYDEWPGGLYGSSTSAGTRGGVPIARGVGRRPPPGSRRLPAQGRGGAGRHPGLPGRHRRDRRARDHRRPRPVGLRVRLADARHRWCRRRHGRPGLAPRPTAGRPPRHGLARPRAGGRPLRGRPG